MGSRLSRIEGIRELLEVLFKTKVKDLVLGFDLEDLSIDKSGIVLEDCSKCSKLFPVEDCGLQDDNVALFWRMCERANSRSTYCAGHDKNSDPKVMGPYRFCYKEQSVSLIEKAIRKSDSIRAYDRACHSVLNVCRRAMRHNRQVDSDFVSENFEKVSNSILHQRNSMWHEIYEGTRRLLVMPSAKWKNEKQMEGSLSSGRGVLIRSLHGNQLRRLVRQDRYNVTSQKPDVLVLGHYHLQKVLRKFDTWILMTGHWLLYPTPRKRGFLSHLGAPILKIGKNSGKPLFKLKRGNEHAQRSGKTLSVS
jgi:hypothetical protein